MSHADPRGRESPSNWNQGGRPSTENYQRGRDSPSNWNHPGRPTSDSQHPPPSSHYHNYPQPPTGQQQQQHQGPYPAHSPYSQPPPAQGAQQHQQADMLTLPPPPQVQHDMYRQQHPPPQHPPPPTHYDPYGQQPPSMYPPQSQQSAVTFNQPAPRQRTAIACRYCRRRKIRCHGFDQNPEGRCSNCVRFNQECVFTPVSSQAHAFVPAHTAYPHLRNQGRLPLTPDGRPLYPQQGGPPLYGAHGQPLGPAPPPTHSDAHYPPPPGPHQPYGAPAPYPAAPPSYDSRGPPHASPHEDQNRRSSGYDRYPDPNHMAPISPASTGNTGNYQSNGYPGNYWPQHASGHQGAPAQQPTPSTQPRTSPTSNYSRASASPHGSANAGPGPNLGPYPGGLHPPQVLPPTNDARNASPAGQPRENGRPNGMRVHDMLDNSSGSQGGRSNTDSNMLNQLNKRAP